VLVVSGTSTYCPSGSFDVSGSTRFGNLSTDNHIFTGSVIITGSSAFSGSVDVLGPLDVSGSTRLGDTISATTHISGALTINNHEFKVLNASSTEEVFSVTGSTVSAGENSPNLGATLNVGNNNTIAGDATLQWSLGGTQKMIMGIDNSNADAFTFCAGTSTSALSSTNHVYTINANGSFKFGPNGKLTLGEAKTSDDATSIDARYDNFIVVGFGRAPITGYTITDIHHVVEGQLVVCQHDTANSTGYTITFQDGTNMFLAGGADFISTPGDSITFICSKNALGSLKLYEIARTVL
jgi:hypothetical protein